MDDTTKAVIITGVFSIIVAIISMFTGIIPDIIFHEDQPPVINDLMSTPPSPQVDGTPITWTAIAKDPDSDAIYYRFELNGPSTGKRYVVKQNWSENNEWIWNSTNSDIGLNYIRVLVKDAKHNEPSESVKNFSIMDKTSTQGEIGYSNLNQMIVGKNYIFSAYVARNDSIDAARKKITTGRDSGEGSVSVLNNTILDKPSFYSGSQVFISKIMIKNPRIGVELTGDDFEISRWTNTFAVQTIPKDRNGRNYGIWLWNVKPTKEGTHFLELTPYEEFDNTPIGGGSIRIDVSVEENTTSPVKVSEEKPEAAARPEPVMAEENRTIEAFSEPKPAAANETLVYQEDEKPVAASRPEPVVADEKTTTEAVAEPSTAAADETLTHLEEEKPVAVTTPEPAVAEENKTTEAVSEPVTAATNEVPAKATEEAAKPAENKTEPTPGFESIFAITGLLAAAYLVLARRE